ncbi:L-lactate dehydrogenase A chain-like [Diachasmimorpha longicaudata]|uniref:L-lactate dehydrogenase A chain-like n=1 Tax=Diachasmimorpha longicaudata TaxID=58733 RepID=UPI0030B8CEC3
MTEKPENTATYLLAKQVKQLPDVHRVKVVIVGAGNVGMAAAISILFKRLASELVLIDANEELARAEAEDISHAGAFLGNPKIVGTKDYLAASDAAVCVITAGGRQHDHQQSSEILGSNLDIFKSVVPNVCKYAPNSILIIVTSPVDILSYVALRLSGFPPHRVIGLGTFLDSCRFQYFIGEKLGISPSCVQAFVIGESSPVSVPVWSAVSVMGMQLKDINREIGGRMDPEGWSEVHSKVVACNQEMMTKKCNKWAAGVCVAEIVDAVVRNTCVSMTVSTYIMGCKHGLEKDIFMSLPCIIGRNGVQSYIRHCYTQEEQELTTKSCRSIYETQKSILGRLE